MRIQVNGTFILKRQSRFLKVLNAKHDGANSFTFECIDIGTRQRQAVQCQLLGLFEALDSAAPFMKNPKDILLMDLDNQGRWKIVSNDQVEKLSLAKTTSERKDL
jgi:hypothetical protein